MHWCLRSPTLSHFCSHINISNPVHGNGGIQCLAGCRSQVIKATSNACMSLCLWVRAIDNYAKVTKARVVPAFQRFHMFSSVFQSSMACMAIRGDLLLTWGPRRPSWRMPKRSCASQPRSWTASELPQRAVAAAVCCCCCINLPPLLAWYASGFFLILVGGQAGPRIPPPKKVWVYA